MKTVPNHYLFDCRNCLHHRKAEEQSKGRLFELERKFETERKENTILLQEKELERKNQTIIYLIVGTVFIILIFLILFVWTKNKNVIKERNLAENLDRKSVV